MTSSSPRLRAVARVGGAVLGLLLALAVTALADDGARAQFNCAEPACLDFEIADGTGPITFAAVGASINAIPKYQFKVGTFTNLRITLETPDYFLGESTQIPDGWHRTCESVPVDPPVPPAPVWRVRCVWEYVDNGGVMNIATLESGTIYSTFKSQLYATPADFTTWPAGQYSAHFSAKLEYTFDGNSYTRTLTRTVDMRHELWIRQFPRRLAIGYEWRGVTGIFAGADGVLGRQFYQDFSVRNQQSSDLSNGGRLGTRTLTNVEFKVTLPGFVRYQGFAPMATTVYWTQGPDHTAIPGQLGGTVHLLYNGPGSHPLGVSPKMSAWNLTDGFSRWFDTEAVRIKWSVDCEEQVEGSGISLPLDLNGSLVSGTTPLVVSGRTAEATGYQTVTTPPTDIPRSTWLRGHGGSMAAGNSSCMPSYSGSGTYKQVWNWPAQQPPLKYPRSGDSLLWDVAVTPPSGAPELGPTTILDKLPPFQRLLSGHVTYFGQPTGWSRYACRIENPNESRWTRATALAPVPPGASFPYFGLTKRYYYDTNDVALDPDTFDPDDPFSPWYWNGTYGCRLADLVCPHTQSNGVWTPPTTCTTGLRADEVTHIVWHRDTWTHPTAPGSQDPQAFFARYYVVVGDLAEVPDGEKRLTVENRFLLGGGTFANPTCAAHPNPDLAWLDRTCRHAVDPSVIITCPDICYDANQQAVDVPLHAARTALIHMDATTAPSAEVRTNYPTVARNLPPEETAVVTCGWGMRSEAATLPNPRFTITLPSGFEPRTHDYDVGTTYQPVPWPLVGGATLPELRYVAATGNNPSIASLIAAGLVLDVDKDQIDSDANGSLDAWRYELEFVPNAIESTFALKAGAFSSSDSTTPRYSRGYFQIAVEPGDDYPYVGGQAYPARCEITDANKPRTTPANDPTLAFAPVTGTLNMYVAMGAEIRMTAEPTCRPNSARPAYRVELAASGVALEQPEGIFILPSGSGFTFEGATLLPNPAITASRVLEVTTDANLDNLLATTPTTVSWAALTTFPIANYASVTGVRLRFPSGTANRLPAYGAVEFRVDLHKDGLTLANIGDQFTTFGWTRAQGTTAIPYARSAQFEPNTLGQCPIGVTVTKRFDENLNGLPDSDEALLGGWTFELTVENGQSLTTAPLLLPDGMPAIDPHADKTGVTAQGTGAVVFQVWPGQVYDLNEVLPADSAFGPNWTFVGQSPAPSGSATPWQAAFDEKAHAFANICACGDDFECGLEDLCVSPGVCRFGQPLEQGNTYGATPTQCEPFRFYALIEDAEGAFVGSVVCFLDESQGGPEPLVYCDADANGVLNVDTNRNACE